MSPDLKLFHRFGEHLNSIFIGRGLIYIGMAIGLTYAFVVTGIDWQWALLSQRFLWVQYLSIPAAFIGIAVPVLVPFIVYWVGRRQNDSGIVVSALAMGQSVIASLITSSVFKSVTSRIAREPFEDIGSVDFSNSFRFGFFESGNVWGSLVEGWPSGHTMTAFAMAVAVVMVYPHKSVLKWGALSYAVYTGLAVSTTVHWLSDAFAGALLGVAIGIVVGKSYRMIEPGLR